MQDLGNINVPTPETKEQNQNTKLRYLYEVTQVAKDLCNIVSTVVEEGHLPIVLGGDHSIAVGSLAGMAQSSTNYGVIWFDAHGDMNTEDTTPSGNIHGMPLAVSLGYGHDDLVGIGNIKQKVKPENVVLVGIHLSLDLDSLDPMFAPGVGKLVYGGVTYREGHLAMEMLAGFRRAGIGGCGGSQPDSRRTQSDRTDDRRTCGVVVRQVSDVKRAVSTLTTQITVRVL